MSTKKILLICFGIILVSVAIVFLIFSTEPTAKSEGSVKESAMLVSLSTAKRKDFTPNIQATGTVRPVDDVMISPLVSGPVVSRSANFIPGSFVEKGELLLQINPADYRNQLELQKGNLKQQKTNLNIEMGRQQVAEQDLALIGMDSLSKNQRNLVLRQPQLNAVKANIQSAQANVNQAELNLSRTRIRAPFDAHILSQNVTVGSQVAPGDDLGRLIGTDYYWVEVTIPVSKLRWLSFPNADEKGSKVILRNQSAWPEKAMRIGYLEKQIGALDTQTRLARILVKVSDPLKRSKSIDGPELIVGSFVEVNIEGKSVSDVVRLNRDYVRQNNTAWVMKEGKLEIRQLELELVDAKYAYVKKGLDEGDKIVITNLSTVAEGVALREDKSESEEKSSSNKEE
ncbi:efflux RND transporter periplasmic adaptor subunit [Psychroflexus aestuariivivens]|uniref:efflux RND transporter periplasmic adaptor subunit n=1 Tax=Psychroflexus aestuariivivens TaxID=1795040 RepID=UPI000FD7167E|nr:efflux RND transporter periplasmic adaptor subunit [Psychroflexus aestuariivivens]